MPLSWLLLEQGKWSIVRRSFSLCGAAVRGADDPVFGGAGGRARRLYGRCSRAAPERAPRAGYAEAIACFAGLTCCRSSP